jgi:crossover junction endodeoxyribonuclease RuvC
MRILGIDPGTAITGFGLIDVVKSQPTLVEAGVIRTPTKQDLPERLRTIYLELNQLIKEFSPNQMAVEKLYFAANTKTAISVSHARGVVLLIGAQSNLSIGEYTPLEIKQAITGYGRADKHQMQAMVMRLLELKTLPKPDDAADALAVALCHQQYSNLNSL